MKKILVSLVFLTLFLGFPAAASAATLDVTVSPVFLDYSPNPGDVIKGNIRLHNNTTSPLDLNVKVDKMDINERGDVIPADIPSGDSASRWFKFNSDQVTAPSKDWTDVPFTLTIPADAAFGNYFAVVFSAQSPQSVGNATVIQGNVLVPVLINVQKAGMLAQAEISEFKVKNFVNEYLPVDFSVSVKSTGNVHVNPRGNIFIRGSGDQDLGILEVNPGKGNILPNTSRTFNSSWTDGFIVREPVMENDQVKLDSSGKPVTHLVIHWNKLTEFRLGKYNAYVLLAYDDGKRDVPIEATLTFWVFPWKAVLIGLGAVVLIVWGISRGIRAMIRKEAKKLGSQ